MKPKLSLNSATTRLAATYLSIIMVLSLGFSFALLQTSDHDIGRQLPPNSLYEDQFGSDPGDFSNFFRSRIAQGRHDILVRLIILNIFALVGGALVSYYLARKTLEPIESAMDAQARFSSDASHELRTPLTAIRARNEVALRKQGLKLSESKEVIKSNLDEIIKLEKLSDGLLRLSATDGMDPIQSPVMLSQLSNEAMNQFIEPAMAKKITIEDTVQDIEVIGDQDSLTQAICILLDNAIKYGTEKDVIYLESYAKAGYGYISVRDSGPGIRASDLTHIFDRFYRADHSRARKSDETGYGLGLSIAKQIVDQHGGEISVSSRLGESSIFTIKLPLNEA